MGDLSNQQQAALVEVKQRLDQLQDERLRAYGKVIADDGIVLRFLRARKFNVDQAMDMLMHTLRFRMEFQGISVDAIGIHNVQNEIRTGTSFYHKCDREGRPVCIIRPRFHEPAKSDFLEHQRFSVLMMEYGKRLLRPPIETVTIIFDMSDVGMKNLDIKAMKFMIQMLQNHYPESLGRVLIWKTTWLFWTAWKILSPLLDPVTAAKVCFVDKDSIKQYIDPDNLLQDFGGSDTYQYDSEKFMGEVRHIMSGGSVDDIASRTHCAIQQQS